MFSLFFWIIKLSKNSKYDFWNIIPFIKSSIKYFLKLYFNYRNIIFSHNIFNVFEYSNEKETSIFNSNNKNSFFSIHKLSFWAFPNYPIVEVTCSKRSAWYYFARNISKMGTCPSLTPRIKCKFPLNWSVEEVRETRVSCVMLE